MLLLIICVLSLFVAGVITASPRPTNEDGLCRTEVLPRAVEKFSRNMNKSVEPCDNFYQYACGKLSESGTAYISNKFDQRQIQYHNCMDWETRRKRGVQPFLDHTKAVTGFDFIKQEFVVENFDWLEAIAKLAKEGSFIFFFPMYYDSGSVRLYNSTRLAKYNQSTVEKILVETGMHVAVAKKTAEVILKFERDLESVEEGSGRLSTAEFNFQELKSQIPDIDWEKYFTTFDGHLPSYELHLYPISYFRNLRKKIDRISPITLANYIFFNALLYTDLILDGRYNELEMNKAYPYGKKYDPDPEYWCRSISSYWILDEADSAYVRQNVSENNKREAAELEKYLRRAFIDNDWSDATTREQMPKDLVNLEYSDNLLSDEVINERYTALEIIVGKYYESQLNAIRHHNLLKRKAIIRPWPSPPSENTHGRKVGLPGDLFQPPFYHHCYPKAINFGAEGTLVAKRLGQRFGRAERASSCSINEPSTNVPDTESIRVAYKAYTDWVKENLHTENPVLPGLQDVNDKQLFFIAYANACCGSKEPKAEQLIKEALSNAPEFAAVFGCRLGSNMNPDKNTVPEC